VEGFKAHLEADTIFGILFEEVRMLIGYTCSYKKEFV
jgi:hypothetical protein